jgi:type IV secretory pathway VirB3-like protein
MSATAIPYSASNRDLVSRLVRAGLLTGIIDGLFSSVLSVVAYRSTVSRLFQGVASVLVGSEAFNGGTPVVVLGVLMHFGVAFGWSAAFLFLVLRSPWVRGLLASPHGVAKVASLYGPFVWMVMSLAVIPLLVHRPPTIGARWWVQLIGHIPFVGLPIVASGGRRSPGTEG